MMDEREVLARSMPPPVDMAVDGNFAGKVTPPFLHELRGWAILPLAALALAGVMAIVLLLVACNSTNLRRACAMQPASVTPSAKLAL